MPQEIPLSPYDQYQRWLLELAPPWLRGLRGSAFVSGLGAGLDEHAALLLTGLLARFADRSPEDALIPLGAERSLVRAPGEDGEAFRTRVRSAWEFWQLAGTEYGLVQALYRLGYASAVTPVRQYDPTRWSEFEVYLYPAGRSYDGSSAERGRILATIAQVKAAHTRLAKLTYVDFGPLTWNPSGLTWDQPGAVWGGAPVQLYP